MKEYKFPDMVKKLMKDNKLSQQKFADKVFTTQGVVYSWIIGRNNPSVYSLMAISQAFDVSIDFLIYGEE